ncbi:MAG: hypothetical protein ABIG11_10825, partial [bacterium]
TDGDKKIRQVADTMNYWPLSKLTLVGCAYSGESSPQSVAQSRATKVAEILSSRYGVRKERMRVQHKISDTPQSMVEIKMISRE